MEVPIRGLLKTILVLIRVISLKVLGKVVLDGKNLVSIEEIVSGTSANFSPVYPNPTKGKASINYFLENPSTLQCTLYNYIGNTINSFEKKSNIGQNTLDFNTSSLKAGIYFISIKLNSNRIKTLRILKI